jgi:hypothetical protein
MLLRRAIVIAIALLAVALFVWQFRRGAADSPAPVAPPTPAESKVELPSAATVQHQKSKIPAPPAAAERSTLADNLNSPTTDIRADLRIVADVIEAFRTNFLQTGNPVGSNAEITAALTGKNKLRLALVPPNHPAINPAGELCDRWGTPFFFHAESATKMEIRSAGPDRKMWTDDDVVLTP